MNIDIVTFEDALKRADENKARYLAETGKPDAERLAASAACDLILALKFIRANDPVAKLFLSDVLMRVSALYDMTNP